MKIRWHGQACFEVKNQKSIVTDPHDGKSIEIPPPNVRADIVLISHDSFDHNCAWIVKSEPQIVRSLGATEVDGVKIEGNTSLSR